VTRRANALQRLTLIFASILDLKLRTIIHVADMAIVKHFKHDPHKTLSSNSARSPTKASMRLLFVTFPFARYNRNERPETARAHVAIPTLLLRSMGSGPSEMFKSILAVAVELTGTDSNY
jgi:hypothetical protein